MVGPPEITERSFGSDASRIPGNEGTSGNVLQQLTETDHTLERLTTLHIGVDIAHTTYEVAIWENGAGTVWGGYTNGLAGFEALREKIEERAKPGEPVHLILEPTGGYEMALVAFARQQGWRVTLVNPAKVRSWAKSMGRRAKTDRQDALMLAQFGAERKPAPQPPMPEALEELDSLLRRKDDIEKMLRQERNRKGILEKRPHTPQGVSQSVDRIIETLEAELKQILAEIAKFVEARPRIGNMRDWLLEVPGIGEGNVLYLVVVLWRWHVLTGGKGRAKALTAYIGLDPQPFESGTSIWKRSSISKMGNEEIRRRLYMGALGGKNSKSSPLRVFYDRLVASGKKKKVALVAAARKILVWAWAVFQQEGGFDASRHAAAAAQAS